MVSGYFMLGLFFAGGFLFVTLGLAASWLIQIRKPGAQKNMAYECGEAPTSMPSSLNFRFYLPVLVFLLFEVEIVLLAPILLAKNHIGEGFKADGWVGQLRWAALIFVGLLGVAYLFALALRYLDWEKLRPEPIVFEGAVPDFAYEQFNLKKNQQAKS